MSINKGPGRPSFTDTFKAALAPREPVKIDPDAPNPIPRTVKIAGALSILSGAMSALIGAATALQRQSIVDDFSSVMARCTTEEVGFGQAVTKTEPADLVAFCRNYSGAPSSDELAGLVGSLLFLGIVEVVIGVALIVGGVGLIKGRRWSRRLVSVVGVIVLLGTMLGQLGHPLMLVSSLLVLISLAMLYVGKGATYFIRAKAQGIR